MHGLTPFGIFHTLVSVIAVAAGAAALIRHGAISLRTRAGSVYVWATVVTCVTGFFLFHHGGFGKPHQLGIVTLVVLAAAAAAEKTRWFGRASAYVETLGYSLTFFFHMIPSVIETATRLPASAPLAASPEAPGIQKTIGVLFVLFLVGAARQALRLRAGGTTAR